MIRALCHGWKEGARAAALSGDDVSRRKLRADFFFSRLLRLGRWPSYNRRRTITLRGAPVCYRFNRGDLQSLREVLIEEVYDCDFPMVPRTMLDLGANIGLTSVWFAHRFRQNQVSATPCQILGVEPMPDNAEVAAVNYGLNQIPGEVVCAAVGQHSGESWFQARAESNLGRVVDASDGEGKMRVPVVGIRELLARFPGGIVDLVKMDIEGAEEELLGRDTDWLSGVRMLMVEWHDDRVDSHALLRRLVAAGFKHQPLNLARQDNLSLHVKLVA